MVEFYYHNVNFCEGYYSPKLLATLPSNLQNYVCLVFM